ncbi:uncharacterized protein LOC119454136 [Dermacentor silvarum]|uniref:uncharacterized protein LOC119454136 n=1 Tax=Dermacentor silvarum TaxID=543639 RepID=UPI002100C469|nr:uncharacterized protein LOC119454136 [Dermacentor silvarum]
MDDHVREFFAVTGFPQAVGALDGCHFAISPPKEHAADCYNYKGWANYYANGRQVRGYHMVNVALHCACSVLVAIVARCVMRIPALHACLAATLFAAHPVHTEAVSSIVGRAEVLCCLFFLLSFLCYHCCQSSRGKGGHGRSMWLAACGLCAVCALLSKEQGITVLPLCMALRFRALVVDSTTPERQMQCHTSHRRRWPICRHCVRDTVYRCFWDRDLAALAALERQKTLYDNRHRDVQFSAGDLVTPLDFFAACGAYRKNYSPGTLALTASSNSSLMPPIK